MALSEIQKKRSLFRRSTLAAAALVTGIVLGLNLIVSYVPLRFDASEGRSYSITSGSKAILKKFDDIITVKVIFTQDLPPAYKFNEIYLSDLLSEYKRAAGGKMRIEYINPALTAASREEAIALGVVPVQLDVRERDRREVKECFMGVAFLYGDKKEALPLVTDTGNLEYEISSRLKRLIEATRPTVGFVRNGGAFGSNSPSLAEFTSILKQLYTLQDVDLEKTVPVDMKGLWLIAPKQPLGAAAIANLREYLGTGGALGILVNNNDMSIHRFRAKPMMLDVNDLLADWGISVEPGLVVDSRSDRIQLQVMQGQLRMVNVIDYPYFPWSSDLDRAHPASKNIDGITLPFVSPIAVKERKEGITYRTLALSSRQSYLDKKATDLNPMKLPEPTEDAPHGPFPLGLLAEKGPSRLILFGTSHLIENEYPARPSNFGMMVNLVDWMVQDEDLIQIRSKGFVRRPLREAPDVVRLVLKYFMVIVPPILCLLIGLIVWRRQKVRRRNLQLIYGEA